jgi:hypothetical protein
LLDDALLDEDAAVERERMSVGAAIPPDSPFPPLLDKVPLSTEEFAAIGSSDLLISDDAL